MNKLALLTLPAILLSVSTFAKTEQPKYNVVFIAVDDLNDWVGFLNGHPQTKTPHMDMLAKRGVVFENAQCAASVCNPSRASLLTGIRPSTSGVYDNNQLFRDSEVLKDAITLPKWFSNNGYISMQRGKIFHTPEGRFADLQSWDVHSPISGNYGEKFESKPGCMNNGIPKGEMSANMDWGPTKAKFEDTPDYLNAKWAADQLQKDYDKPFFLACGIFRPHLEWFVPKEFYDKFPVETMVEPPIDMDDLKDCGDNSKPSKEFLTISKYNKRKEAIQAYLACINYADSCVGVLLDGLYKSKYANNTIVVFWGDHGWHLGEKLRYKKFTLWEEACHMPLIISVPGLTTPGARCTRPVNLIDLYPTLVELCGLPKNTTNEGRSIVSLLKEPSTKWDFPSVTTMGANRHSVRSEEWRYIHYNDGSEELYDHRIDPQEYMNVVGDPKNAEIKAELMKSLPKVNHEAIPASKGDEKTD